MKSGVGFFVNFSVATDVMPVDAVLGYWMLSRRKSRCYVMIELPGPGPGVISADRRGNSQEDVSHQRPG